MLPTRWRIPDDPRFASLPDSRHQVPRTPRLLGTRAMCTGTAGAVLACMRLTPHLLLACALLTPAVTSPPTEDPPADDSVVKLRVVTDAGIIDGTGVVIHRDDRGSAVVLYLLTSSRLFKDRE